MISGWVARNAVHSAVVLAGERLPHLPGGSPRRRPCCRGPRCAWPRCSSAGRPPPPGGRRTARSRPTTRRSSPRRTGTPRRPWSRTRRTGRGCSGCAGRSRRSGSSLIAVCVISHAWTHIMRAECRRVDLLPATRALPGEQGGHDAERQLHRAGVIGDRRTRRHRRAVGRAGDGGQPAAGLRRTVEHRLVGVGPERRRSPTPGRTPAGGSARPARRSRGPSARAPRAGSSSRTRRPGDQPVHHLATDLGVGVEGDAPLAAVHRDVLRCPSHRRAATNPGPRT